MAIKEQKKTIDGREYYVTQLPPTQSLPLGIRLLKVVGPAGKDLKGITLVENGTVSMEAGLAIIGSILSNLHEEKTLELLYDLLKTVRVKTDAGYKPIGGQDISIDVEFNGRLGAMLKVAMFTVQVNYANFIPALGNLDVDSIMSKLNV